MIKGTHELQGLKPRSWQCWFFLVQRWTIFAMGLGFTRQVCEGAGVGSNESWIEADWGQTWGCYGQWNGSRINGLYIANRGGIIEVRAQMAEGDGRNEKFKTEILNAASERANYRTTEFGNSSHQVLNFWVWAKVLVYAVGIDCEERRRGSNEDDFWQRKWVNKHFKHEGKANRAKPKSRS